MTAPQWPGTPAEWDAERDRRARKIKDAIATVDAGEHTFVAMAIATMPPRPVEPPSVTLQGGERIWWDAKEKKWFIQRADDREPSSTWYLSDHIQISKFVMDDNELRKILALRDGPTARYEVCGYEHWRGNKYVQTFHVNDNRDAESCKQSVQFEIIQSGGGGTAHAIYKRVGGA